MANTPKGVQGFVKTTYQTTNGDTLRLICHRHYGQSGSLILNAVIRANPWVVSKLSFGPGEILVMPGIDTTEIIPPYSIKLWDDGLFIQAALADRPKKKPSKVSEEDLLDLLDDFRKKKKDPVPDEEPPEPRPPLPYGTNMDFSDLSDPYSLLNDALTNLN